MKWNRIIYWASTGVFSAFMLFSSFTYFTNEAVAASFTHLGFPGYFRVELGIAKALGVIALVMPQISYRIKEWAYAGFEIVLISASIAHAFSGDGLVMALIPVIFLGILVVSNLYLYKKNHEVSEEVYFNYK